MDTSMMYIEMVKPLDPPTCSHTHASHARGGISIRS